MTLAPVEVARSLKSVVVRVGVIQSGSSNITVGYAFPRGAWEREQKEV